MAIANPGALVIISQHMFPPTDTVSSSSSSKARKELYVAGLLCAILIASVFVFGFFQRQALLKSTHMTLAAVTDQKIQQILQWTNRFLVEAEESAHHPDLVKSISEYVRTGNKAAQQNLIENITSMNSIYDYVASLIVDFDLRIVVSSTDNIILDEALMSRFDRAEETGRPILSDLYMLPPRGRPGLTVIAPVFEGSTLQGYIINMLYAEKELFPMLARWPVPSETSETFLVRKSADAIEFLSPLRFTNASPLTFSQPGEPSGSVEAKAIAQPGVIVTGNNYSHRRSFALAVEVEDTGWYLLATMGVEEAFKPQWIVLVLFIVSILLGAVLIAYLVITASHRQSHLHYRKLFDIERETRGTQAKFMAFMDNMPSMAMIKDEQSRVIFANKEMQAVFHSDDWLGKTPDEIFGPVQGLVTRQWDLQALKDGYVEYEEKRVNAKGEAMILLTQKFRIYQEEGAPLIGQIVTDISERDQALEQIRELKTRLEKSDGSD